MNSTSTVMSKAEHLVVAGHLYWVSIVLGMMMTM